MSHSPYISSNAGPERDRPRILVADDDPGIRTLLRLTFETAGFEVIEAANGNEAREKAFENPPDVFVTDLAMPEGEGLETLRHFQCEFPSVPTVAISGAFSGGVLRSALYFGARAIMQKPLRTTKLLEIVSALMASGSLLKQ
jgi:DNA-binding NtrC family response regulator